MRAQRHIRPHVNPLQSRFTEPPENLSETLAFSRKDMPLHIDIGCGKGHFCADLAAANPALNVIGIEIRHELVSEANRLCELSASDNLRFVSGSANTLITPCCEALPDAVLTSATIQFPDPWPKRRHHKRRVCQPPLVHALAEHLVDDGVVFLQSDVQELAADMRSCFLDSGFFREVAASERDADGWLLDTAERPFGAVQTERERQALRRNTPVWRCVLFRSGRTRRDA